MLFRSHSLISRSQAVSDANGGLPRARGRDYSSARMHRFSERERMRARVQTGRRTGGRTHMPLGQHAPTHAYTPTGSERTARNSLCRLNSPRVFSRPSDVHRQTPGRATHAYPHARECEITRGDGRGQRLRDVVLGARREHEKGAGARREGNRR